MIEHFKGDEIFVAKVKKYQQLVVEKQQIITTPFLDPYQRKIVQSVFGKVEGVTIVSCGGIENAESQRMVLAPSFYQLEDDDFKIVILEFKYNNKFDTLEHKDILGTLMSLGLKREFFGDIVPGDSCYYVAVDKTIVDTIILSIEKIKRTKVKINPYLGDITRNQGFTIRSHILSSLRLDKVVSTMYGMPRSKAVELIRAGLVKVNYKVVDEIDFLCNNDDILSIRRYGRVMLRNTNRTTKSDNHVYEGLYYK